MIQVYAGNEAGHEEVTRFSPAGLEKSRSMIRITIEAIDPQTGKATRTGIAEFPSKFAPAFRSAINEIRGEVGGRLEGMYPFKNEQALTDATVALGKVAAGINQAIPAGDAGYEAKTPTSVDAERAQRDAATALGAFGRVVEQVIPQADSNYR